MRVKNGTIRRKRVKKILKRAKGFRGRRSEIYRIAKEAVMKALSYEYRDRKQRKRHFRRLWIMRINAAVRQYGLSYSKFMNAIKKAGIKIDRKMLSELAIRDKEGFKAIVDKAKAYIE